MTLTLFRFWKQITWSCHNCQISTSISLKPKMYTDTNGEHHSALSDVCWGRSSSQDGGVLTLPVLNRGLSENWKYFRNFIKENMLLLVNIQSSKQLLSSSVLYNPAVWFILEWAQGYLVGARPSGPLPVHALRRGPGRGEARVQSRGEGPGVALAQAAVAAVTEHRAGGRPGIKFCKTDRSDEV